MKVDWKELAIKIGSIRSESPNCESGGNDYARRAFEEILGDEWVKDTVEYAISGRGGQEIAMNCLRLLSSEKGCMYAYEIYKESNSERASEAVWLIKHICNKVSFRWIEEFLNDENVRGWGLEVLDQLLFTEKVTPNDETERLLCIAEKIDDLKNGVNLIRGYLQERK
ncbi:MAG: hypothetical protein JNL72_07650 [Flavipsychrobacter sp.]|nr:hypothetical protein [Flavipsychrobacter sp.]